MRAKILSLFAILTVVVASTFGQVTSSSITGSVRGEDNKFLEGATVVAVHQPSGTKYSTTTGKGGLYTILNVRVGGPYLVTFTYAGFKKYEEQDVYASLGSAANVDVVMKSDAVQLQAVVVRGAQNPIMNSKANGASITLGKNVIGVTPTIGRTVNDIVKYNAYGNGRSFAAQDSRFNNFTIDGSVFNNGFGLGSQAQAGGRTGSTAISLDALEELQVNITPYDIKQSGFVGANLNAVTRSGTNDVSGSAYRFWSNRDLAGTKANSSVDNVPKVPFASSTNGFRVGGPIIKNKLFFFINGEFVKSEKPALDWVANKTGATGNVSRTTEADLLDLKAFMKDKFNWDMGAIDNYNNISSSNKMIARIDYNISDKHKLTVRYSHHDSQSDAIISNSNSSNTAGNGNRQNLANALSGQNTGYIIMDNTRSAVAELTSNLKKNVSNQFLVTFNKQIEDRKYRTELFPTIDILKDGNTYTTIGFDPFTPDNKLNYQTFNVTNNTTFIRGKHNITVGASFEAFKSNNLFFYGSNGVWVFNSIADFKTAATAYLANPNLTTSPVAINRFNYRYTLLPDGKKPWQTFKNDIFSAYIQDEYKASKNFRMNYGIRLDYLAIPNTASDYTNKYVSGLTFFEPSGEPLNIDMGTMPGSRLYVSPRWGFNWDVKGNRKTQIRGGSGLFLSRMPYVLLSNQLGNNGVNIGLMNVTGTAAASYPFTLNPTVYKPTTTDVTLLRGYNLNYGEQNLKFPMNWKTNIAIDQKINILGGLFGTVELIYNKNLYALHYIDANLKGPVRNHGVDRRNIFPAIGLSGTAATQARFHNPTIGNAFVLTNNNVGHSFTFTTKLEKPITRNWGGMFGYTYGRAYDLSSVGSTVNANTPSIYGQNFLRAGFSDNDLRHRFVGFVSYKLNYGKTAGGGTTFSLGMVSASGGKISYTTSTDMNGDGQTFNDLIYVPQSFTTTQFLTRTVSGKTFTAAEQAAAFETYIQNHPYLSTIRGQYAARNGGQFPWLTRFDFSAEQDFFVKTGKSGKSNTIRLRVDIINASNLVNNSWGVGYVSTTNSPLIYSSADANGNPIYQLATQVAPDGSTILLKDAFLKSKTLDDVYQIQFGIRYIFNN
jgi:hypothetical protein